jgi:hypothetical protein
VRELACFELALVDSARSAEQIAAMDGSKYFESIEGLDVLGPIHSGAKKAKSDPLPLPPAPSADLDDPPQRLISSPEQCVVTEAMRRVRAGRVDDRDPDTTAADHALALAAFAGCETLQSLAVFRAIMPPPMRGKHRRGIEPVTPVIPGAELRGLVMMTSAFERLADGARARALAMMIDAVAGSSLNLFEWATEMGSVALCEALAGSYPAWETACGGNAHMVAAGLKSPRVLIALFKSKPGIVTRPGAVGTPYENVTPMQMAVRSDRAAIVKFLVGEKVSPTIDDLLLAIRSGSLEALAVLLAASGPTLTSPAGAKTLFTAAVEAEKHRDEAFAAVLGRVKPTGTTFEALRGEIVMDVARRGTSAMITALLSCKAIVTMISNTEKIKTAVYSRAASSNGATAVLDLLVNTVKRPVSDGLYATCLAAVAALQVDGVRWALSELSKVLSDKGPSSRGFLTKLINAALTANIGKYGYPEKEQDRATIVAELFTLWGQERKPFEVGVALSAGVGWPTIDLMLREGCPDNDTADAPRPVLQALLRHDVELFTKLVTHPGTKVKFGGDKKGPPLAVLAAETGAEFTAVLVAAGLI